MMTENGFNQTRVSKENSNGTNSTCSGSSNLRRNSDIQMASHLMDPVSQNLANLILPTSQANHLFNYQNTSFSGLYSSPGFNNSITGYENNLQWITDNRMQTHHNQISGNVVDKSLNHVLPPTTSHSCCVNRFSVLDSLGMGSPLPNESVSGTVKPGCDVSNYQNKSNLAVNMIDPIQSWLNLQMPNNQQYCKYNERSLPVTQNYNPTIPVSISTQMNLPIIDQSDLKQNDISLQSPDVCFENINANNSLNKQIDTNINNLKQHSFPIENKHPMSQENSSMLKQQSSYQSSMMPKDWKSTFQSMQNYISSPNMFGPVNETQDNLFLPQYTMPPGNSSYYSTTENYSHFVNKNNACMPQNKHFQNRPENNHLQMQPLNGGSSQLSCNDQIQTKLYENSPTKVNTCNHYVNIPSQIKENSSLNTSLQSNMKIQDNRPLRLPIPDVFTASLSDCCQVKNSHGSISTNNSGINGNNNNSYSVQPSSNHDRNNGAKIQNSLAVEACNQNDKSSFKSVEIITSESDESNIIVEESDDIGEIESEISIEEIKKTYQIADCSSNKVLLRCLVCNVVTSVQTPASQFVHMNESFPLTSSRTPVCLKLKQVLPLDLQSYLKLRDSFMCRRCLNLIETVEVLEVKLTTAKQTITDNFSKTVQQVGEISREDCNVKKSFQSQEKNHNATQPFVDIEMPVENGHSDIENDATNGSEHPSEHQCPYCGKELSSQKSLDLHLQQHTKEFNFYCDRCGKGFPLKYALEQHLNWHNRGVKSANVLCEICGEVFSEKRIFYSHQLKYHSGTYKFKCKTCEKGFMSRANLNVHSHKHSGVRPFVCECCGLTFKLQKTLKYHVEICRKNFRFSCDLCNKGFVFESELTSHKLQHNGIYKLKCSLCGKGFDRPSNLDYHMLSHSTDKRFKCDRCDKSFKTVGNLNYHAKAVHNEERLFKCSVCARTFSNHVSLSDHMNSHRNEKPYKCERCDKCFTHQTTFITHLKTHTGKVKLKTCQVCGKEIKTRMSVHMRTHTGERPYKCTLCPLAFTVGISLKNHIKNKHCT